ncbi:MAG: radical SAM protein [Desulfatirhabdiaceae bacterium]
MKNRHHEPSYLKLHRKGLLLSRVEQCLGLLKDCCLCPRKCHADRLSGELGVCRTGIWAKVASFHPHFGEEAPLSGSGGSGTIFFSSCNLFCSFCQNSHISHLGKGDVVTPDHLADMMLHLMKLGCHNINLVTPTHVIPQILQALVLAVEQGLNLPLVYNSGGYDLVDTIKILDGIVDIYMPDFKFWNDEWAIRYCQAPDYRQHAMAAIREMHRQVGDLILDQAEIASRGLLVRHLVMPNGIAGTGEIMTFLAREVSRDTTVNIMAQYHPCGKADSDPNINRRITLSEYAAAVQDAVAAGIHLLE